MLTINANAKINLYLEITGTLENGYHALSMIMQSISLCDTLTLEPADALCVHCPGVPQEQNSAFRAGQLFFEAAGLDGGAHIEIFKRIPSQAGLGGGSADAAAVLLGLSELYGHPLSLGELARIAVRIGADVPFFLKGGCQQCQGIGEVLAPLGNALAPHYLVIQPEGGVSTPAAYRKYDGRKTRQFGAVQAGPCGGRSGGLWQSYCQQPGARGQGALPAHRPGAGVFVGVRRFQPDDRQRQRLRWPIFRESPGGGGAAKGPHPFPLRRTGGKCAGWRLHIGQQ